MDFGQQEIAMNIPQGVIQTELIPANIAQPQNNQNQGQILGGRVEQQNGLGDQMQDYQIINLETDEQKAQKEMQERQKNQGFQQNQPIIGWDQIDQNYQPGGVDPFYSNPPNSNQVRFNPMPPPQQSVQEYSKFQQPNQQQYQGNNVQQDYLPNPLSDYSEEPANDRYPKAIPFAAYGDRKQDNQIRQQSSLSKSLSHFKRKKSIKKSSMEYRKSNTAQNKLQNYTDTQIYVFTDSPTYHSEPCCCQLLFLDDCCCKWICDLFFHLFCLPMKLLIRLIDWCLNGVFGCSDFKNCYKASIECLYTPFHCYGEWINQCWFSCCNFCCKGLSFFPDSISNFFSTNWCLKCCTQFGQFFKNCCSFPVNCFNNAEGYCCCEQCCLEIGSCCQYLCSPQGCTEQCFNCCSECLKEICCNTCSCEDLCGCCISSTEFAGGAVGECCCCIIKSSGEILSGLGAILD